MSARSFNPHDIFYGRPKSVNMRSFFFAQGVFDWLLLLLQLNAHSHF